MNKNKILAPLKSRRQPVMDLLDHIAAAQNLREISRLLNSVIVKFGRQGIIARGPHGDLQKCFNLILRRGTKLVVYAAVSIREIRIFISGMMDIERHKSWRRVYRPTLPGEGSRTFMIIQFRDRTKITRPRRRHRQDLDLAELSAAAKDLLRIYWLLDDVVIRLALAGAMTKRQFTALNGASDRILLAALAARKYLHK
jgi:hypothetical protein